MLKYDPTPRRLQAEACFRGRVCFRAAGALVRLDADPQSVTNHVDEYKVLTCPSDIHYSKLREIQRTTWGSARRLAKLVPRLRRLQELNPDTPTERLVAVAAGQIIA